jgi:hypothetical protein
LLHNQQFKKMMEIVGKEKKMPLLIIHTIDGFFWNGTYWDDSLINVKKFPDKGSAIRDLINHGQIDKQWLIRPFFMFVKDRNDKNQFI